jgi:hypothetical protein
VGFVIGFHLGRLLRLYWVLVCWLAMLQHNKQKKKKNEIEELGGGTLCG